MDSYKCSISGDSRYLWFYSSFQSSAWFLTCWFPWISEWTWGGLLCLFVCLFLICLVFSCLLCRWLNNNLTESEEITHLCEYFCLVLCDSWFASVCLKDLWVFLVIHLYMKLHVVNFIVGTSAHLRFVNLVFMHFFFFLA